ncbi:immunodominant staphylococcal antigen IsaB family protein, partial [Staphylococcus epidermidis]|uniref:immunodominant staphylococcal antigen IsaB family protein n=1 Tax=Staphylococcus epidermidis TaxID=1282 RepID=UPI0037D99827
LSNQPKTQTPHTYSYKYNPYTPSPPHFLLTNSFYQPLKPPNLTFNPINLNQKYQSNTPTKKIYHHTFQQINRNKPNNLQFKIASTTLTLH